MDKIKQFFNWFNRRKSSFGMLSLSSFWLVVLSGIPLIFVYDIADPKRSLELLLLKNPIGIFFRSVHYWSAQILVITLIIHTFEYLFKYYDQKIKTITWLKITFIFPMFFYLMISGYILKDDADGKMAREIVDGLVTLIPFGSEIIKKYFIGTAGDLTILYYQHIVISTLFLFVLIVEHGKRYIPLKKAWRNIFYITLLLSVILPTYLHQGGLSLKGPWYFVAIQELLHLISSPEIVLAIILFIIFLFFILRFVSRSFSKSIKQLFCLIFIIYIGYTVFAFWFRGPYWQLVNPLVSDHYYGFTDARLYLTDKIGVKAQKVQDNMEGCLLCHKLEFGFSKSHLKEILGCSSCHLGNVYTSNKQLAHSGMVKIPGNLDMADKTCGTTNCHQDIVSRVDKSLMNSLSGMISVDRFVFGEIPHPNMLTDVKQLKESNADSHLKQMCIVCHLGNNKEKLGANTENSRGGGCLACHLNYDSKYIDYENYHPQLSINVSDSQCFGCHSRSGRISTNFEGWHETQLKKNEIDNSDHSTYRVIQKNRVFKKAPEDIHYSKGLECIDCHVAVELMGDNKLYAHEEMQTVVSCTDCHRKTQSTVIKYNKLDNDTQKIVDLRFGNKAEDFQYLLTQKKNIPLPNVILKNNELVLISKNANKTHQLKKIPSKCSVNLKGHDNITCSGCHSGWAPQCITCHTQKDLNGKWVEYAGEFLNDLPPLGIRNNKLNNSKIVDIFVPGMILTIGQKKKDLAKNKYNTLAKNGKFSRYFAPSVPHTTQAKGRSCISCHWSSNAIGVGRGTLEYEKESSEVKFTAKFENIFDGLPADAWRGFLTEESREFWGTRDNIRPFNRKEQLKTLRVGVCLKCHSDNAQPNIYTSFDWSVENMSNRCRTIEVK